jgi:diguanylate cyclase (GGDEF)-like protein/PAS domain S-box-containing protein
MVSSAGISGQPPLARPGSSRRKKLAGRAASRIEPRPAAIAWEADAVTLAMVRLNLRGREAVGLSPRRRISGLQWSEWLHPADRLRMLDLCREVGSDGRKREIEYRLLAASGRVIWLHDVVRRVELPPGTTAVRVRGRATEVAGPVSFQEGLPDLDEQYRLLFERNPLPMWVYDYETLRFLAVNQAAIASYGYERDEFLAMTIHDIRPPETIPALLADLRTNLHGHRMDTRWTHRKKDGGLIEVEVASHSLIFAGRVARFVLANDVTRRIAAEAETRRAEAALHAAAERYRTLFERNLAGVFRTSTTAVVQECNDAFARILGFAGATECIGINMVSHYAQPRERTELLAHLMAGGTLNNMELQLRRRDGTPVWVLVNATLLGGGESSPEQVIEGTLIDITQRKTAERQLVHQAYHDALTGLPNRMLFHDRLKQSLAQARRQGRGLAVLFLDLDRFKLVNDTLGHAAGDRLLQSVAARLRQAVRESDTVARVGGDEFNLLLPGVDCGSKAAKTAEKILTTVARPVDLEGHRLFLTTSIGISMFPADAEDAEALLTSADIAMYRAKELGRNGYQLCTPAMNAHTRERLTMENDLRHALERGELQLFYQPQVEVATGNTVGVEALLRWQHPVRGMVLPDAFIGVAEEARLIVPIGEWALGQACAQAAAWHAAGWPELRLAVNLSALQFQQTDLTAAIRRVLDRTGLDPRFLQLEITESTAMSQAALTVEMLTALRGMGLSIALDDFGTGHTSLAYLKQFPIDALKMDRGFVADIEPSPRGRALVTAIVNLAHGLGLRVIAEGVETAGQLAFLRASGCDEVQGFLLSRPLPPGELAPPLGAPGALGCRVPVLSD